MFLFKKKSFLIKRFFLTFLFFFLTYGLIWSLFLFLNKKNIYKDNSNSIYNEIKNIKENKDKYIKESITDSNLKIFSFYYKINLQKENVKFCPIFKKNKIIEKDWKYLTTICLDSKTKLHLEFIPSIQIFHPTILFIYLILAIISILIIYLSNNLFFLKYSKDIIQSYSDNIKKELWIDFNYILNIEKESEILDEIDNLAKKVKERFFPNQKLIENIVKIITIILINKFRKKDLNLIWKFIYFKHFYWSLIEILNKYKLNELTSYIYYYMQVLTLEYYILLFHLTFKIKERIIYILKILNNLFNLITTKYWTSEMQLLIFILIFTFINSIWLGIIINSQNLWFNYYETMSILSNLGWNIEFKSSLWIIYGVYLQITGVIFFWILVNIIWKKINI